MILLRILKNERTPGIAGWIVMALGLFMRSFIEALQPGTSGGLEPFSGMPFYGMIFGKIHTVPLLDRLVALILILLIGYMLIRISYRFMLLDFRSVMPAFFFMLFAAGIPSTQQVNPALVGTLFFLLCFNILFDLRDKKPDTLAVFHGSLILALGSMFYLKLIWFIPLIWICLATLRHVTWRELVYPVVAYLMLGLFLFTWYWTVQGDAGRFFPLIRDNLAFTGSFRPYHQSIYLYYGYLLLLVLLASIYMVNRFQSRKTAIQVIYQVLFYIFLAGLLFFLLIARFDPSSLVFMALPVSFILSFYFHRRRGHWLQETALWILVGMLVYLQWMG